MKLIATSVAFLITLFAFVADRPTSGAQAKDAKTARAKVNLHSLDLAVQAYFVQKGEFPKSLNVLTEGDKPYIKADSLLDPWKKQYLYYITGPKNDGKKPDIWTIAPDKTIIGNWPEKK